MTRIKSNQQRTAGPKVRPKKQNNHKSGKQEARREQRRIDADKRQVVFDDLTHEEKLARNSARFARRKAAR